MKLSILFLLFNLIQLSASVYSQNTQFKLKEKNMSLKQIFKVIETQTNYRFAYRESFVDDNEIMKALSKNMSVEQFLEEVVKEMGYGYLVLEDNLVVITAKDDKLLTQEITIKGKITDKEGTPLPGVNVVEKGTTNGAVSNLEGEYIISVSSPDAILSFSYVGYLTEEVAIGNQTTIDFTLMEDIRALEEVVVVGYGTQKRVNLTGSVGNVQMDDMESRPLTNASLALQGTVAGVYALQSSGKPGDDHAVIDIRGVGTFGDNSPLIIIDGFPGNMSDVNANDIKSISVLEPFAKPKKNDTL